MERWWESGVRLARDAFSEEDHPRGQPDNAGQFAEHAAYHESQAKHHGEQQARYPEQKKGEWTPIDKARGKHEYAAMQHQAAAEGYRAAAASGVLDKKTAKLSEHAKARGALANENTAKIMAAQARRPTRLDDTDRNALKHYTSIASGIVNEHLRNGRPVEPGFERLAQQLDTAMNKSVINKPIILHRLVSGLDKLKPGDVYHEKAFVSTSNGEKYIKEEASLDPGNEGYLEIRVPAGTHGIDLVKEKATDEPQEREVLLDRGYSFKVISTVPGGKTIVELLPKKT